MLTTRNPTAAGDMEEYCRFLDSLRVCGCGVHYRVPVETPRSSWLQCDDCARRAAHPPAPRPATPREFHPTTDHDWSSIHESAHVAVARRLGCPVSVVCLFREGDGYALIGHPKDAGGVFNAAVVTAAGVVVDRLAGQSAERSATDRKQIEAHRARYKELAGAEMPDPFTRAHAVMNEPGVAADIFKLAPFIATGRVLSSEDLDCILGPATPAVSGVSEG